MSEWSLAHEIALDAIIDQAHDLMGCYEALEEVFDNEGIKDAPTRDRMAHELSAELYQIAERLGQELPNWS